MGGARSFRIFFLLARVHVLGPFYKTYTHNGSGNVPFCLWLCIIASNPWDFLLAELCKIYKEFAHHITERYWERSPLHSIGKSLVFPTFNPIILSTVRWWKSSIIPISELVLVQTLIYACRKFLCFDGLWAWIVKSWEMMIVFRGKYSY